MTTSLVILLHLCDSLFPIGSFAHSDGLEAATSTGQVGSADHLRAWMEATLSETLRFLEGPAVHRAWHAFSHREFRAIVAMDDEVYALRPSSAGREATRAMGARLLKTWQQIRPCDDLQRLLSERASVTLPVAFGAVSSASAISDRAAVEGFMYTRLSAVVSAAMRLMSIGQLEGHTLLAEALERVPTVAGAVLLDNQPFRIFTPALDIAAMSQQYGHSRLFRS